jgi:hypothetical protein
MSTPVGTVRGLIPDIRKLVDPADPLAPAAYLFEDDHLQMFLTVNGDRVLLAAAQALMALAANEALVSKKIRTEDLSTDGPAVSAELRRLADSYRLQQLQADNAAGINEAFTVVDFYDNDDSPFIYYP